ncbi:MAG: exodeoxyribonuclease VII small subunit [Dysgonamonadaceae bacterium]|jgi:exodeoxyribonuclease VII small subunit|nr:exodeoxyribonuclease VII small subunit [Dysgonamonadaceae bacterium]
MKADKDMTYKEAFTRLEAIHELIMNNKIDVDDLSEKLKEASKLMEICKKKLFLADEETKKILNEIEQWRTM